jgi:hypothetical protein
MNFLTDSVLIILIDLMNFRLTGYAKLYSWTTNSECVEWKYVNYMKIIFQSIGLDHLNTTIYVLIKTYLSVFSVKQFKIRNYLGDCKWALHQTIAHLIFHQGNKHIYAVWMISGPLARGY